MALHNDFQMNPDIFLNVKEKKKKRLENIVPQKLFLSPHPMNITESYNLQPV